MTMKLTIVLAVVLCLVPLATGDFTEQMTKTALQALSTVKEYALQTESGPCERCKAFLGDVRDKLDADTFQDLMVSYIYNVFCLELPSVTHKLCHKLANHTVPALLSSFAGVVEPKEICTKNMFCSPTFQEDINELKEDVLMFVEKAFGKDK